MLCEIAQGLVFGENNSSPVRRQLSDDHLEKCGFPGTIDAYKSSLFSVFYMKGPIFDDDLIAERFV